MTKSTLQIGRVQAGKDARGEVVLPSLSECRQLAQGLRDQLDSLEQKIQMAHDRLIADAHLNGENERLVYSASATVILSIAASMMEFTSYRMGRPFDESAFLAAARVAVQSGGERSGGKCEPLGPSVVASILATDERDSQSD
ncbi:hypothetical protein [Methylocystis iwaonis]|uniref:Uncharacterized protein n=1 Tax=Methylocystis iwaonis TaxID=2885079 RepID=A0ABN6VFU7_9HYPH|nr:hypothetical protein [Methylocystis iwaonis]BDV33032.1 hypothetical protein SS37A_05610 [Methylocystis iwaonis]